ncbi:MAG: VanW family protein [Propionibacteriaceae bacterium]|nr:VanW family protein [Propionibacteriaceae bacterium]
MTDTTPETAPSPEPRHRGRGGRVAAIVVGGIVLLAGGAYGVGYAMAGETMPPNTVIQGVPVGGLTPAEAEAKVASDLGDGGGEPITLKAGEHSLTKTPAELGLGVDAAASVAAGTVGKSFNPAQIWESLTGGRTLDAVPTRDEAKLDAVAAEMAQLTDAEPVNAELAIEDTLPSLTESTNGRALDADATKEALVAAFLESTEVEAVVTEREPDVTTAEAEQVRNEVVAPALSGPIPVTAGDKTFEVTPEMVGAALTFEQADGSLKPTLDPDALVAQAKPALDGLGLQEPKDASFVFADGKPSIVPSENGKGVAKDELAQVIGEAMVKGGEERRATVTVTDAEPEFTTAMAEKMGVKEITGEFTTHFPASAYRVNNIGKSAGLINGVFLKPGEEFSMNKVLGPRTLARGWMAGGAIDGGRVVERMGGGISQTTTTTFNAIFFAGLEDIYHKPHSLYFSRYPMGREATLDYHSVDMKFRNNTDYGVLMQAFTNNPKVGGQGSITVRVWSTKVYDVKATDPVRSNVRSPGPAIKDNSAVCSPQGAMNGFTVNYSRQFFKDGALVKTEPFKWTYNTLTPVQCTNPNARRDRVER